MDTTPEYIKMCEKAKEIQESHHWIDWDYLFCPEDGGKVVVISGYDTDSGAYGHSVDSDGNFEQLLNCREEKHIWLPCQDQLQAMIENKAPGQLLWEFYSWYQD